MHGMNFYIPFDYQQWGKMTVSVGLYSLKGGMETLQWGHMMAASVLVVIPSIVFFSIIQKSIVGGLTAGADK